jgi:hypothetical protein
VGPSLRVDGRHAVVLSASNSPYATTKLRADDDGVAPRLAEVEALNDDDLHIAVGLWAPHPSLRLLGTAPCLPR